MNLKIKHISLILGLFALIIFQSCNGDPDNNNENGTIDTNEFANDFEGGDETFYLIPSPESMFAFTQDGKLLFSGDVLNPTENTDKYVDAKTKELNFGIYSADLAYAASFGKYQETLKYLNVVRNLSDDVSLSSVFDQSLVARIDNIIENQDSLLAITNDTYFDIVRYLESAERDKTLALIVTGGWLESMYIVTQLIDNYDENDPTIQLIADQKIIFENLISYLKQNNEHTSVVSVLDELKSIEDIYANLESEILTPKTNTQTADNQIIVGGASRIMISEAQYTQLKSAIMSVRNSITAN